MPLWPCFVPGAQATLIEALPRLPANISPLCMDSDKCVFAGEGYRKDTKMDSRRQLLGFGRLYDFWEGHSDLTGAVNRQGLNTGENIGLNIELVGLAGFASAYTLFHVAPAAAPGYALAAVGGVAIFTLGFVVDGASDIYRRSCLPGDALVQQLINGQPTLKPIASVPHGAHVLTSGGFSPIYLFSHKDHTTTAVMRHIETESGHAIQLTRQHYIQADGQYMSAEKVTYGMQVPIRFLNGTLSMSAVHTILDVEKQGLFNPMTMRGDVVVFSPGNSAAGVVVSDQSEWWAEGYLPESIIPSVYHTVLSPVRFLHSIAPAWTERFHAHTSYLLLSIPGVCPPLVRSMSPSLLYLQPFFSPPSALLQPSLFLRP